MIIKDIIEEIVYKHKGSGIYLNAQATPFDISASKNKLGLLYRQTL